MINTVLSIVSGYEIGFTASQPRTISSQTMIFSKVLTNIENRYSNITGEFTCNRPGLYYFALSLSKARTSGRVYDQIWCHIRKNRNDMIRAWLDPTDDTTDAGGYEASNFLLLHLNVGDIVDVGRCQYNTSAYGTDSSFTGFLVN